MLPGMVAPIFEEAFYHTSLHSILLQLGLGSNLLVCLDAGDLVSYDPAIQAWVWYDTSGGTTGDWFLGDKNSSNTHAPVFNGVAGDLSENEFFSWPTTDDYFRYSDDATWDDPFHKDNATFTAIFWVYTPASATTGEKGLVGNFDNPQYDRGIKLTLKQTTNNLRLQVARDSNPLALDIETTTVAPWDAWNFVGVSVNEAAPQEILQINTTQETFTTAYAAPYTGTASKRIEIGATGQAKNCLPVGCKMGMAAIWDGTLSAAQLNSIYNATRSRYSV